MSTRHMGKFPGKVWKRFEKGLRIARQGSQAVYFALQRREINPFVEVHVAVRFPTDIYSDYGLFPNCPQFGLFCQRFQTQYVKYKRNANAPSAESNHLQQKAI